MRDEWHKLTKVILSICDDYMPVTSMSKTEEDTLKLGSRRDSAVRIDHMPQD